MKKKPERKAPKLDLNPSSADRWMTCTASPQFIMDNWDLVPPDTSTSYSMEGTTAHEVASALLLDREPDPKECPTPVDADMQTHGWNYMEYVEGLRQPGSKLIVEQKLPLWYMPERNAKVDAAIVNPDSLEIVDYKYGAGVLVSPDHNLQAVIYAYSVGRSLTLTLDHPIGIHIYQPRTREDGAPYKVWQTTWAELLKSVGDISRVSAAILNKSDGLFFPSEKACQWCPAKGFCTARVAELTKDLQMLDVVDEKPLVLPPAGVLTLQQRTAILKHGAQIKKWLEDSEEDTLAYMKAGNEVPGFKLVTSRGGNRYWTDPKQAAKLLLKDTILKDAEVNKVTVISPGAAEKLLGKHKFNGPLMNLIGKPPGNIVVAPVDDKRDEVLMLKGEDYFEKEITLENL